jgi:MFS family permease
LPALPALPILPGAALRRNVALDALVAAGVGITTAVVTSLVPAIARQAGLAPLGLAVIAAGPYIGNFLAAFAGRTGPHGIRGYAGLRVVGALLLIAIAIAPDPALISVAAAAFWIFMSFGAPFQTRLWGAMYPGRVRGRVIGTLGTVKAATAGVAAVAVGLLADRLGVPAAVSLAGVAGAVLGFAALGLRSAAPVPARPFSAREAFGALTSRPCLARLVLAQLVFGVGTIAATPLYALVFVDRLHLSLADVGAVAVVGGISTTVAYLAMGAVIDRHGHALALRAGALTGAASVACFALAGGIPVLWAAAILGGISAAGIDIGIQGAMSHHTPLVDRAAAMAGWNAATGPRGIVAPLLASAAVQAGLLDVTGALLLCVVPAFLGFLLYLLPDSSPARTPSP